MIRTNNPQINTKIYWNYIYNTPAKKLEYWSKTDRFPEFVKHVKDGDKVLDIGCGVGIPGRTVLKERKGCEIWGVDISSEIIEANKKDEPKIKWHQGYVGRLDFLPENYFDIIFSGEVAEHLDNPLDLFRDAYRLLKKGGQFVITTPNKNHVDSSEHVWYFERIDVKNFFKSAGFEKIKFINLSDMEYLVVYFAIGKK